MNLLHDNLTEDELCISYLGAFDDEITTRLIGISEFYLTNKTEFGKIKNKVSFLIAECFQNIVKHGDKENEIDLSIHSDFFQINILPNRIILSSCNLIKHEQINEIEKRLIDINSLNASELKSVYMEMLKNEKFSDKGGAGLGLIEMARKSSLPIKYLFNSLDSEYSRFYLSIEISTNKENVDEKAGIEKIVETHQALLKENIMMLYKGEISTAVISPFIEMLHNNFVDRAKLSGKEKRTLITLIEILQNISKHAKEENNTKKGIFTIVKTEHSYIIEAGNYVKESDYSHFENILMALKKMTLQEIDVLYKKLLIESKLSEQGRCGLGLLEIAKNSHEKFDYTLTPFKNDYFYSLKVFI